MKTLMVLISVFISYSANAFNRIDCSSTQNVTPRVELSVDLFQPFSANLAVTENGNTDDSHFYNLIANRFGMSTITLWTGDFNLRIDTWPDNTPMFGRNYSSTLQSSKVQNGEIFSNLECAFY